MMASMTLETIDIETGDNPTAAIVLMHGLGADGNDFVPIAREMDLSGAGPVRFVFPNAPSIPVTINGGYVMPAWYDLLGANLTAREDEAGLRKSQAAIEAVLAREKARGIAAHRIVIAGFSQGCAMALLTGLRHAEPLAGIVGLSGYLPLAAKTAAEQHAANAKTPVFLGHGNHDDIVPVAAAHSTRDALLALGHPVDWNGYDMPHSVCMEEIGDLNRWLLGVLASA
jgi:phospholipase/carboxylesterase